MNVEQLGRGYAWLDTGTPQSLLEAGQFVETIEQRTGQKVASPEEIAFEQGFIDRVQLKRLGEELGKSSYGQYLIEIAEEGGDACGSS